MKSDDLATQGIEIWAPFSFKNREALLDSLPESPGVYAIREAAPLPYARGESDLIHIGSACNERGMRGRIRQYFSPGPTQSTNLKIYFCLSQGRRMEIAWKAGIQKSEAEAIERRLHDLFSVDHGVREPAPPNIYL